MQSFATSTLVTSVALGASAVALAALGATPALASTTGSGPASAASVSAVSAVSAVPAASDATSQSAPYVGRVTSPIGLNIRAAAATDSSVVGVLAYHQTFDIRCKVPAGLIDGNRLWYKLSDGSGWVSARYVANVGPAPRYCD